MLSPSWVIGVAMALQGAQAPPTAPAPQQRPLTHVVQNLHTDLRTMFRPGTFVVLGVGSLGAGIARPNDHSIERWARRSGESRSYTPIGSLLGNEWLQGGAAVATYVIGTVQESPQIAHIGSDLIRAQTLNGVLTVGLKLVASRERPNGGRRAFPSGHSSATFASASVLAEHYGWKVGVPAYAVAGFIGWTRVRDREHWLSDVVFGSSVGIAAGLTVTRSHGRSSWIVAPATTPGGAAILAIRR